MKLLKSLIIALAISFMFGSASAQKIAAYYNFGTATGTVAEVNTKVGEALKAKGFKIIGTYNPARRSDFSVIVFTSTELESTVLKLYDRSAIAAVLKVGLRKIDGKIEISMTNPEYLFNAYLRDDIKNYEVKLQGISAKAIAAVKPVGNSFSSFGGEVEKNHLRKYQYMFGMPYFTDPVELEEFASFEEAVNTVEKNLKLLASELTLVYRLTYTKNKQAVYGFALNNKTTGEAAFLPIIGTENIAAMPYEIIIQRGDVTMLNGRFRLALSWPELTMGTFTKIMSTPGDIEDAMKQLVK